jgi:hypothetical protein
LLKANQIVAAPALPQGFSWHDEETLFNPTQHFIRFIGRPNGPSPVALAEWNQFWHQSGDGSRKVDVGFVGGSSDLGPGEVPAEPAFFQITRLDVAEGTPLAKQDWSHYGADISSVGPASTRR